MNRLHGDSMVQMCRPRVGARSRTLGFPFLQTADVAPHLMDLLRRTEAGERKVRLLGVSFSSLGALSVRTRGQLDLFDPSLRLGGGSP